MHIDQDLKENKIKTKLLIKNGEYWGINYIYSNFNEISFGHGCLSLIT